MYIDIHIYRHTYKHIYIYIHTHTYTYIHIHINMQSIQLVIYNVRKSFEIVIQNVREISKGLKIVIYNIAVASSFSFGLHQMRR